VLECWNVIFYWNVIFKKIPFLKKRKIPFTKATQFYTSINKANERCMSDLYGENHNILMKNINET
jgi:hypothetical protein